MLKNSTLFWELSESYRGIHGWLSIFVCMLGLPSHVINMLILSRKNMVKILISELDVANFIVLSGLCRKRPISQLKIC